MLHFKIVKPMCYNFDVRIFLAGLQYILQVFDASKPILAM